MKIKENNLEEKSKIYMIYDCSNECIKILSKDKTKAFAKVGKDALLRGCINDYKLIEINLDEVDDD